MFLVCSIRMYNKPFSNTINVSFGLRRLRKIAARVPQPALLLALYQPLSRCCISQLFLHHAGYCRRCHRSSQWVRPILSIFSVCWIFVLVVNCPNFFVVSSVRFHSLVIDVTMALDTLSLPVLEPLTPGRLLDVTVLALSCLYAGLITDNI